MTDVLKPKGYIANKNIDNDTMAEIYRAQIERGMELELCTVDRLAGLVDGFKGFEIYWGKKHPNNAKVGYFDKNGNGIPSKAKEQLLIYGVFPDVDILILNQVGSVVCVVSSKGSLSDSNVYSSVWHSEHWDFPMFIVTKDEKKIFKSGRSKYIPLLKEADAKVFISNHQDYDKPTESGKWEDYEWNETVHPEHTLHSTIHNRVLEMKENHKFFAWKENK